MILQKDSFPALTETEIEQKRLIFQTPALQSSIRLEQSRMSLGGGWLSLVKRNGSPGFDTSSWYLLVLSLAGLLLEKNLSRIESDRKRANYDSGRVDCCRCQVVSSP